MKLHFRVNAVDLLNVHFTVFESEMECGQLVMCLAAFWELIRLLRFDVTVTSDDPRFDVSNLTE